MEAFVPAGTARLWTAQAGAGFPVLFCHGGPGLWDDLDDLSEPVGRVSFVLRFDQRGGGRSTRDGPHTVAQLVDDMEALRRHWGIELWVVLGHSWGADLALAYAASHPERVRGLVLIGATGIDADWHAAYTAERARRMAPGQEERFRALRPLRDSDEFHDEYCTLAWVTDYADGSRGWGLAGQSLRAGLKVNFAANTALNADWARLAASPDFRRALASFVAPALVIHGERDPRPAWAAERLRRQLGGPVEFVLVPGAGHLPWVERPAPTLAAIERYLAALPGPKTPQRRTSGWRASIRCAVWDVAPGFPGGPSLLPRPADHTGWRGHQFIRSAWTRRIHAGIVNFSHRSPGAVLHPYHGPMALTIRAFQPGDAPGADALLRDAFADDVVAHDALAAGTLRLSQTGSRLLVAEDELGLAGLVRWWDDDGVAWADLLVAAAPGAGRELVRAVERAAQDRGLRVLRGAVDERTALPDYFGRLGYLPVARRLGPPDELVLEKRLPLLTVREQRRTDSAVLVALTGEDPYVFEMGPRPGWFVLADGDRVCGAVNARAGRDGVARITPPIVVPGYERRGLELWMIDRAAVYAATAGCHTARVPAVPALREIERDLEAHLWRREADEYARDLATIPLGLD